MELHKDIHGSTTVGAGHELNTTASRTDMHRRADTLYGAQQSRLRSTTEQAAALHRQQLDKSQVDKSEKQSETHVANSYRPKMYKCRKQYYLLFRDANLKT